MKKYVVFIIGILMICGIHYVRETNNSERPVCCNVFKKYDAIDKYGNRNFYMVLTTKNESFTLGVTPYTYFSTSERANIIFNLRPSQYQADYNMNLAFLSTVLELIIAIVLLFYAISLIVNYYEKRE